MVIWTRFMKKHLRNILGSYGRNMKKVSNFLLKTLLLEKRNSVHVHAINVISNKNFRGGNHL